MDQVRVSQGPLIQLTNGEGSIGSIDPVQECTTAASCKAIGVTSDNQTTFHCLTTTQTHADPTLSKTTQTRTWHTPHCPEKTSRF